MNPKHNAETVLEHYDVVVIGGALAGASTALLLRRANSELRILVVESSQQFGHKVGEATVEVSGFFLEHVLQLGDHLYREHLPKHGLRYWFAGRSEDTLETMGEVGAEAPSQVPSYQLDRSKLDQHVLDLAENEGCELLRPAKAVSWQHGWPKTRIVIEGVNGDEKLEVSCRWLVDGSGRQAFVARKLGLLKRLEEHPTVATWSRWTGVLDFDGHELLGAPDKPALRRLRAQRRLATNHFCGHGWWTWVIPLSNGKTSVGLVYDRRLLDPQDGVGPLGVSVDVESGEDAERPLDAAGRYERFVRAQPGLRQLLADAEMCGDGTTYSFLPYRSSQYMDLGWALTGDAAGFIDPFYSPGLDHLSMTVVATVKILDQELRGSMDHSSLLETVAAHNKAFTSSYRRWFEGLYKDKYQILGDADLVTASFLIETSLYYAGVVTPILRDVGALRNPVFGGPRPVAKVAFRVARAFRRRMVRLAELRLESGLYGRRNRELHCYPKGFGLGWRVWPTVVKGLSIWLRCEVEQLLTSSRK